MRDRTDWHVDTVLSGKIGFTLLLNSEEPFSPCRLLNCRHCHTGE